MTIICVEILLNLPSRLEYAGKFYAIVNMLGEGRSSFNGAVATALLGERRAYRDSVKGVYVWPGNEHSGESMSESNSQEDQIRRIVRDETQGQAEAPPAVPIADPAPLGLAAFALTTFLLSLFNAGLLPESGEPLVFPLAAFYGGLAQFVAGIWEFRNNNTFGATAFTSYGAFWLTFWALETFYAERIPAEQLPLFVGWFLISWAVFTAYMWIGSFKVSVAVNILFLLLTATFFLLGLGDVLGSDAIVVLGGYVGLVTALVAWYASAAGVVNDTIGRIVLPVGARG